MITHLNEEPRSNQSQSTVLAVEAVMVGIKRKMIKVEEPTNENHNY